MSPDQPAPSNQAQTGAGELRKWPALVGITTLIVLTLGYYVYHKPVGPRLITNLVGLLLDLVAGGLILIATSAVGRVLLRRWIPTVPITPSTATVVGMAVTGTAVLILGLFGLLLPYVVIPLTAVLLLVARSEIGVVLEQARGTAAGFRSARRMDWLVAGVVVVMAGVTLGEAAAPPVKFDALVYHLAIPQEFIRTGTLLTAIDNPFWGQPMLAEAHFAWIGLLTGRTTSMTILGWLVGLVALSAVHRLSEKVAGGFGWIAVASLMAGFTVWNSLGWGYTDWWVALAGVVGAQQFMELCERPQGSSWWLLGLAGGAAIAIKLTSGLFLVSALAVLLILRPNRPGLTIALKTGAVAALVVMPWLVLNTIGAGTPLYPFVGRSAWIAPATQSFYRTGGDATILDLVLLPVRATILGVEGAPGFSASIGPLLAGLTGAGLIGWGRVDSRGRRVLGMVAIWWLLWAAAAAVTPLLIQSRLYFVMYPAWAAGAAVGYRILASTRLGNVRLRMLTDAVVILVIVLSGLGAIAYSSRTSAHSLLLGQLTKEDYLTGRLGATYPAMQAMNKLGAPEDSVLMLWEPRSHYCAPACVPDPWIARWYAATRGRPDPLDVLSDWKAAGFQYLLIHEDGRRFVAEEDSRYQVWDWEALEELIQALDERERIGSSYTLYRIP